MGWLLALALALCSAYAVHCIAGASSRGTALLRLLRVGAWVFLASLFWKVFVDPLERIVQQRNGDRSGVIVLLEDRSSSMELHADTWRSRRDLAGNVARELADQVAERCPGTPVRHFLFGRNVVPEERASDVDRSGTRLVNALNRVLSREEVGSLLIVSDGAASDGIPPSSLLAWARNRGVPVRAVVAADPEHVFEDRAIVGVECDRENPTSISVRARKIGSSPEPMTLTLGVDGEEVARVVRRAGTDVSTTFRLPPVDEGWHRYTVATPAVQGEATTANNRVHGVYRTAPGRRILFVHDEPRIENVDLVGLLRRRFEALLEVQPLSRWTRAQLAPARFGLVILADIDRSKVPATIRKHWLGGEVPLLVLGGKHLASWRTQVRFPLDGTFEPVSFRESRVSRRRLEPAATAPADLSELADGLRLGHTFAASERKGAAALITIADSVRHPLLTTDDPREPRVTVLLSDTTWKWARHADRSVRRGYEDLWFSLVRWLSNVRLRTHPLRMEILSGAESGAELSGVVRPTSSLKATGSLRDITVKVEGSGETKTLLTTRSDDTASFSHRLEDFDGVLWVQASGRVGDTMVESEKLPLVRNPDFEELREIRPDDASLSRAATVDDGIAWYPERSRVLAEMTTPPESTTAPLRVHERDSLWELVLSGCLALFLGLEWWWERRLHAGALR